jgi:hypothetical protein
MATARRLSITLFSYWWPCNPFIGMTLEPLTKSDTIGHVVFMSEVMLPLRVLLTKRQHAFESKTNSEGA